MAQLRTWVEWILWLFLQLVTRPLRRGRLLTPLGCKWVAKGCYEGDGSSVGLLGSLWSQAQFFLE